MWFPNILDIGHPNSNFMYTAGTLSEHCSCFAPSCSNLLPPSALDGYKWFSWIVWLECMCKPYSMKNLGLGIVPGKWWFLHELDTQKCWSWWSQCLKGFHPPQCLKGSIRSHSLGRLQEGPQRLARESWCPSQHAPAFYLFAIGKLFTLLDDLICAWKKQAILPSSSWCVFRFCSLKVLVYKETGNP